MEETKKSREYEPPQVKDLRELSLYGQWPLSTHSCSEGSGNTDHTCTSGTDAGCADGDVGFGP